MMDRVISTELVEEDITIENHLRPQKLTDYIGQEIEKIELEGNEVTLKLNVDFTNMKDEASFYYKKKYWWEFFGKKHKLSFKLDHFTGCRFGLFVYSTKTTGGSATFKSFNYINR